MSKYSNYVYSFGSVSDREKYILYKDLVSKAYESREQTISTFPCNLSILLEQLSERLIKEDLG